MTEFSSFVSLAVYHSVEIPEIHSHHPHFWQEFSWKQRVSLTQWGKVLYNAITLKNIREINSLDSNFFSKIIDLIKKMIIFLQKWWSCFDDFSTLALWVVVWKNVKCSEFFSSNQLYSYFFSKNVAFTKYLGKKCEREFLQFSRILEKQEILCHRKNISWNQL